MKKALIPILIAVCVLAAGCAEKSVSSPPADGVSVYRVLSADSRTNGELLKPEQLLLTAGQAPVLQAAAALSAAPKSVTLKSPFPEGVSILDAKLTGNTVTVSFNDAYLKVTGIDKTILDACVTLTMCSLENVDFVSISVGGKTIGQSLNAEDFLLFNNIISTSRAQVRIYFPKTSEKLLGSEYKSISFDDDNSAERRILDTLFEGPAASGLKRAFPVGTIVTSVYTLDGVCSVSLSGIVPDDPAMAPSDAKLAVYSVVNSLTALSGISSVQILIDGKPVQYLWGFDISHPLNRNEGIIGSAVTG